MIKNPTNQPYFYVITNKINGRYYYGSGISDGYEGSGKVLKRAYKKYGKESFEGKVLRLFNTREDAFEFESRFLSLYKLDQDPVAYNVCRNANGGYISDEVYASNSKFMKEYRQTEEGSLGGLKNPRANQTIYEWYNRDTGEYLKATQYELNQIMSGILVEINGKKSICNFTFIFNFMFRLRNAIEERERYSLLKKDLINKYPTGKDGYISGKTDLINEMLDKSGFVRWKPPKDIIE
jgi:hypothetical protein